MTPVASGALVSAIQWEFRVLGMVKAYGLPLRGSMALLALCTKTTAMDVLDLVTLHARMRRPLVTLACVACGTGHLTVGAVERKRCFGMVERLRLAPVVLAMARSAIRAQIAAMRVIALVAVDTTARCFSEGLPG